MIELLIFGALTGLSSGFFGIGGGMVLVPLLLFSGYAMEQAVAISIMQMVFSSIYGTFLNAQRAIHLLKDGLILGIGGFVGGLQSGYIVTNVEGIYLQYLFLAILLFSIYKIFSTTVSDESQKQSQSVLKLFTIGFLIGIFAMSIGIGGTILLTPILVSLMKYNLKYSTSLGLFFVAFSSIAGFISLALNDAMLYKEGFNVAIASLVGVYFGIKIKNSINLVSYKKYILFLYIGVLIMMLNKLFL